MVAEVAVAEVGALTRVGAHLQEETITETLAGATMLEAAVVMGGGGEVETRMSFLASAAAVEHHRQLRVGGSGMCVGGR